MMLPNQELIKILSTAYSCPHFSNSEGANADTKKCLEANFQPDIGQIPRGFIGAVGAVKEVEAIFVLSEPGHPYEFEKYDGEETACGFLKSAVKTTFDSLNARKDIFHRNVNYVLNQLWPNKPLHEQLKRVWITESRLCSIENEIGSMNDRICAQLYLQQQTLLLQNAIIITFGRKAKRRVEQIKSLQDRIILNAWALAPPGANRKEAKASWDSVIEQFKEMKKVSGADSRAILLRA